MAPLGRSVPCFFRLHPAADHPQLLSTLAPYVKADVVVDSTNSEVELLIDTGADITILSPPAALQALGWQYLELDFDDPEGTVGLVGVGHARTPIYEAELVFADEAGNQMVITAAIGVAEPIPAVPGWHGNWVAPSVLGRDVLQRFDLRLGFHPPLGVLTEVGASP